MSPIVVYIKHVFVINETEIETKRERSRMNGELYRVGLEKCCLRSD